MKSPVQEFHCFRIVVFSLQICYYQKMKQTPEQRQFSTKLFSMFPDYATVGFRDNIWCCFFNFSAKQLHGFTSLLGCFSSIEVILASVLKREPLMHASQTQRKFGRVPIHCISSEVKDTRGQ